MNKTSRLTRAQRADLLLMVAEQLRIGIPIWAYMRYRFVAEIVDVAIMAWPRTTNHASVCEIAELLAVSEACALGFDLDGAEKVARLKGGRWVPWRGKR